MKKDNYIGKTFIKINSLILKNPKLKKVKNIMYYIDKIIIIFMKNPKYYNNNKKQVLIMFNLALGDSVIFLSTNKYLRQIFPSKDYNVTLTCQKGLEKIFASNNYFDEILPIDYNKGTFNIQKRYENIKKLRGKYYDIVCDPIGANDCTTNVLMTNVILSKQKVGCVINDTIIDCPDSILKKTYHKLFCLNDNHFLNRYFEFINQISNSNFNISLTKIPSQKCKEKLPQEYYIIFPSASTDLKRWPIDRYADIAKKIYQKTKIPLLLCGTNADDKYCQELVKMIPNIPCFNLIGKTSLLEFVDVINRAKFVITNDTSTYHIAAINQIAVAIIAGGYTYNKYIKYEFNNKKYLSPYIISSELPCFNCNNVCKKIKQNDYIWPCLEKVSSNYAWEVIEKMINNEYLKKKV